MIKQCLILLCICMAANVKADADTVLMGVTEAFRNLNYDGRLIYLKGDQLTSMRLLHRVQNGVEQERLLHLDGAMSEVIRNGEQMVCLHPDKSLTRMDNSVPTGPFSNHLNQSTHKVNEYYIVESSGVSRVAGRFCDQVSLRPRVNDRYGFDFCIDKRSGILLKSVLVDDKNRSLEQTQFVSLVVLDDIPDAVFDVQKLLATQDQQTIIDITPTPIQDAAPVNVAWLPDGFIQIGQDLRRSPSSMEEVRALMYSDGLTALTLFVEPRTNESVAISTRVGPTVAISRILSSRSDEGLLVTLVGEIPTFTAEKIISQIQVAQ